MIDAERQEYFLTALWDLLTLPHDEVMRKYDTVELLDSVEDALTEIEAEKYRRSDDYKA